VTRVAPRRKERGTIPHDQRFRVRVDCRACGSRQLHKAVPLNPLPLVSPNVGTDGGAAAMAIEVPLDLYRCEPCGLLQLTAAIDPAFQYNKFKYVTSISVGLPEHFTRSAAHILGKTGRPVHKVLEIGSNDGTLLRAFQRHGVKVLGIDPAERAAGIANERGIPTLVGFFGARSAPRLRAEFGPADIVIANNTLANIDDLADVAAGLDAVLAADGMFVFETSYGADVVRRALIDTIYHEHLSYFMVKPLAAYFARFGFELFDVERITTKGGSIRGYVQRAGGKRATTSAVAAMIAEENADGLYRQPAFDRMSAMLETLRRDLRQVIDDAHAHGRRIAGFGASVGCVTEILQFSLTRDLDCIFDDTPLLDTIAGPGYAIPVLHSAEIAQQKPDVIIVLAWRYADRIVASHQAYRDAGGTFIVPFPKVAAA
jgi:SAM-dependent methyltransferase